MKKKQTTTPAAPNSLELQAQTQLNAGKYKEAIRLYKKLLKISDNSEWHKKLADCYVQRALALAAKGMIKEAVVLWENHRQHTQAPYAAYEQYNIWLILSKNKAQLQENIQQLTAQQLDKEYPTLAAVLGLLILTEDPEFALDLPQDSMFIAHLQRVKMALQAYQNNNREKLDEALKKLPYRSAFKDFRTMLNTLISLPESIGQARVLLAKIPDNSAYFNFAQLLLVSTFDGAELAKNLVKLSPAQRNIISHMKGFNKTQLEFLAHLTRQYEHLSDKAKFNMTLQYQSLCGTEFAKNYCQQLLVNYSAGHKDFKKNFGAVDEFENNRIHALSCESVGNGYDAEYYWRLCIKALIAEGTAENNFKIALILRHLSKREEPAEKTELLIESLQYDAEDRDIYLQILQHFQQAEATKDYKLWLSKALKKFPQDIDILIQAVREATRNKTYKKASQYATKILKIDPLNTFAKQTLFASHLAHAYRLMREKSYPLVAKEIALAEALNIGKIYVKQTQLMRALLCFAHEDKEQGLQLISDALANLYTDPVNRHFHASMAALSAGLPVATILRILPPAKDYLLTESEFTQFIQLLEQFINGADNSQIHKVLEKVKAPLKKTLTEQEITESTLLHLCKLLEKLEHFELLRHCAKTAFAKWQEPIWMYYRIYADNNGKPEDCTYRELMSLEHYHEQAMLAKDFQTGIMLEKLIDRYYQVHPQKGMNFFDDLFGINDDDDDNEEGDKLDILFGHLSDEVVMKLDETVESLSKKTSIEQVAIELIQSVGEESVMLAIMQEPDLFSALMVVKAADKLGINIDVSLEDVLECYGVGKKIGSSSFPFPF